MAEPDFEIEYLDEDEDVVQQCVQTVEAAPVALIDIPVVPKVEKLTIPDAQTPSLLVERTPVGRTYKRKKKRDEEDSDYDPNYESDRDEDYEPGPRRYKKKQTTTPRPAPATEIRKYKPTLTKKEEIKFRKEIGVRIPNFEDPLCLPVKAILNDENDLKKLRNWNNLCLNGFKNHDTVLKPQVGETVRSQRNVVLKCIKNKQTGKTETTIWSKLTVQSASDKKAEVFQSVLPKYREGKVLDYPATLPRKSKSERTIETTIITKEEDKGEVMVVYKPQQALSAVYRLVDEKSAETDSTKKEEEKKQYLQELTACKMCAPCYQCSWRGFRRTAKKKSVVCPICVRSFVSVYNLLAHVKTHSAADVHKHKTVLGKSLATVVDYHYRCRICQEKSVSIKELRKHVLTHQSSEHFQCEVCNRVIKNSYSM